MEIKRFGSGYPKTLYERELNKPDVHQRKGRWNVSKDGKGGKGCRHISNIFLLNTDDDDVYY